MSSAFLGLASEQALRHVADALADGVFTTDAKGRITYWNEGAHRILGWTADEALGADCSLLAGDAVNGCSCGGGPIRCGLAMSGCSSKQCTTRTKDGRPIVIVKSAAVLRDASGEHVGALESFTLAMCPDPAAVRPGFGGLVGGHPAMLELYRTIELVASSAATVIIVGESGAGKDRVAEAIHALGPRSSRPLVRVRCAEVDALLDRDGFVAPPAPGEEAPLEQASGGTLLLAEIGNLSPSAQLKLLRYLERRETARSGPVSVASGDARVLCTTSDDVRRAVEEGRFRADLYFRLNVFPVRVPPLREHVEDVIPIARHLLRERTPSAGIAVETGYALAAYHWPGNVRELENVLEYAALRSGGKEILPEHLPPELFVQAPPPPPADERARLAEALARCGGSRALAARALGISRVTLWRRMRKHGVIGPGEADRGRPRRFAAASAPRPAPPDDETRGGGLKPTAPRSVPFATGGSAPEASSRRRFRWPRPRTCSRPTSLARPASDRSARRDRSGSTSGSCRRPSAGRRRRDPP